MGGLLLTTRMHHIPLMPPYVLPPPATVQPSLAQGLGLGFTRSMRWHSTPLQLATGKSLAGTIADDSIAINKVRRNM